MEFRVYRVNAKTIVDVSGPLATRRFAEAWLERYYPGFGIYQITAVYPFSPSERADKQEASFNRTRLELKHRRRRARRLVVHENYF